MSKTRLCCWCDAPATYTRISHAATGKPELDCQDDACDLHTEQWLRPSVGRVNADGSWYAAPVRL